MVIGHYKSILRVTLLPSLILDRDVLAAQRYVLTRFRPLMSYSNQCFVITKNVGVIRIHIFRQSSGDFLLFSKDLPKYINFIEEEP